MTGIVLRPAGDRAVLIDVADTAAAARVASRLRAVCPSLVDVVPGHRTVLATWLGERPPGLAAVTASALADDRVPESPMTISVPVSYDGLDLAAVAEHTGLSVDEVVATHSSAVYTVGFLGFAPGFAYLVGGDERLHVPRRTEPRTTVPAGSVAIAGPYSGIYPREGPGGWRLLGRTALELFDPSRTPPALFAAGDLVRFVTT